MTHHDHNHGQHGHQHGHEHGTKRKKLHHDWRAWAVVVLMLVAMAVYVLSDNEAIRPAGGPPGEQMPAAAGP